MTDIKPMYRGDSYPDWDDREEGHFNARHAAEQEIQEELNNELNKEYEDLLVKQDGVDRSHYQTASFEPIEIIEEYGLGFNLGNAIKYILRAPFKGSFRDDLKKSIWYLERELQNGNRNDL